MAELAAAAWLPLPTRKFALLTAVVAVVAWVLRVLNTSRVYDREQNTVGREYDAWTSEGILEYYWGEHIHLGYYGEDERRAPSTAARTLWRPSTTLSTRCSSSQGARNSAQFFGAMAPCCAMRGSAQFSEPHAHPRQADTPKTVLDVGCGIGGTSRYLAKKFPEAQVTGITISEEQIARATALASERGIPNAKFELVDALNMKFADDSFDLVWACESGEHMPDKEKYVQEMARVLKPGGRIAIATWCQREEGDKPFTPKERATLDYLYGEWTHPYFISIDEYVT